MSIIASLSVRQGNLDLSTELITQTFTQQNEHCDWLMFGHEPLIKFNCIPTGLQLRSCRKRAECSSMVLTYDCLRESLNI